MDGDGAVALTSDGTVSPSYGISISARDYALFHQWIAQGKALIGENETGKLLGRGIT